MAKRMTNAQLTDENIALRHNIDLLKRQLAELTSAPAPTPTRPAPSATDVVHSYVKSDGSRWNKVRIGYNTYAHRPA